MWDITRGRRRMPGPLFDPNGKLFDPFVRTAKT
jgi:hypothetical protein